MADFTYKNILNKFFNSICYILIVFGIKCDYSCSHFVMIAQNESVEYQLQCLEQQVEPKLPIIFCLNYFVSFMAFVLESPLSVFTKRRQTLNVSKLF